MDMFMRHHGQRDYQLLGWKAPIHSANLGLGLGWTEEFTGRVNGYSLVFATRPP